MSHLPSLMDYSDDPSPEPAKVAPKLARRTCAHAPCEKSFEPVSMEHLYCSVPCYRAARGRKGRR